MSSNHANFFRQLLEGCPDKLSDEPVTVEFRKKKSIIITIKNFNNGNRTCSIIPKKRIVEIEFGDREKEEFFAKNSEIFLENTVTIIKELQKASKKAPSRN
jgi:hypothetical protein